MLLLTGVPLSPLTATAASASGGPRSWHRPQQVPPRGSAKDATEEDTAAVFPVKPRLCRRDIGNTMFCTFETEEACRTSFEALQAGTLTLKGETLRGGVWIFQLSLVNKRYEFAAGIVPSFHR